MGLALISLGTNDSYGQNSDRIVGPRLYVEEVLPNWDYYQGYSLYIEGTFECLTELYCDFVPVQGQARIVWVNITMLTTGEKRQLRDDCNASCDVVVFGQVNLTNIMASEIRKIEKK
jgi:hypothetical protein